MRSATRLRPPQAPTWTWTFLRWLGSLWLVASVSLLVTTALPGAPFMPMRAVLVFVLPAIFLFFVPAIAWLTAHRGRQSSFFGPWIALTSYVGKRAIVLTFAGCLVFWLCALTAVPGLGADPEENHGVYTVDDHGSITVITRSEYLRHIALQERLYLSIGSAFLLISVLVYTAASRARIHAVRSG